MNPILIVALSEFLRRVKSKAFIITTLLAPLAVVAFMAFVIVMSVDTIEGDYNARQSIAVVDETGFVSDRLLREEDENRSLARVSAVEIARDGLLEGAYDAYVRIPVGVLTDDEAVTYYTLEGGGFFGGLGGIHRQIQSIVREKRIADANIPQETLEIVNSYVEMETVRISAQSSMDDEAFSAETLEVFGSLLGLFMGMLIFMSTLLYGQAVMLGVMEEKQTRVIEILISSVRPFHLLMGKVLGIGAMGLVQLTFWALSILGLTLISGTVAGMFIDPESVGLDAMATNAELMAAADFTLPEMPPLSVQVWFILFFAGGYLLYASLFAAIGSMAEQQQDTQALIVPLMLPLMLPMFFLSLIVTSPNSPIAVTLSMIPFTSPVPMVVRLTTTVVPLWEVMLSFTLLVAGAVGTVWVSSRIYRVGVLMYGKKVTLKDAIRWIRHA